MNKWINEALYVKKTLDFLDKMLLCIYVSVHVCVFVSKDQVHNVLWDQFMFWVFPSMCSLFHPPDCESDLKRRKAASDESRDIQPSGFTVSRLNNSCLQSSAELLNWAVSPMMTHTHTHTDSEQTSDLLSAQLWLIEQLIRNSFTIICTFTCVILKYNHKIFCTSLQFYCLFNKTSSSTLSH